MKVLISCNEFYPVFFFSDDGIEIELTEDEYGRYKRIWAEYEKMQGQLRDIVEGRLEKHEWQIVDNLGKLSTTQLFQYDNAKFLCYHLNRDPQYQEKRPFTMRKVE